MKVVIISGEDTQKARKRFGDIIAKMATRNTQAVVVKAGTGELMRAVGGGNLFAEEQLFTVDNGKELSAEEIGYISSIDVREPGNLLIFIAGTVPQAIAKGLPKATHENFAIPKDLFPFLESLYPGNAKTALLLYARLTESEAPELVSAMILRHLRDLWWVTQDPRSIGYPDWRVGKLTKQAQKYQNDSLVSLYETLVNLDVSVKKGEDSLETSLDYVIAKFVQ